MPNGRFVGHWGGSGSVPDMSRPETRMWFYFLASSYIDVGIEAIHFGQVGLMDKNDPGHAHWIDMLDRVRGYARKHARRHFLLCDAHTPTGGYVEGGKLLFDFHSFPLRIAEVPDHPFEGVLKVGNSDAIFLKSKGGITPSGWSCEHLPYLVEFDNFGRSNAGEAQQDRRLSGGGTRSPGSRSSPRPNATNGSATPGNGSRRPTPTATCRCPAAACITPGKPDAPRWYWANTRSERPGSTPKRRSGTSGREPTQRDRLWEGGTNDANPDRS